MQKFDTPAPVSAVLDVQDGGFRSSPPTGPTPWSRSGPPTPPGAGT